MANSGLPRKKPFLLLATIVSFVLLTLACITHRRACYNQSGFYNYASINSFLNPTNGLSPDDSDCASECAGLPALKFVRYSQPNFPTNVVQVVRCPWENVTRDLFLASACLMCLWVIIELFMTHIGKYKFFLNFIIFLFVLPLGSVAAGYMLNDIHDGGGCPQINQRTDNNIAAGGTTRDRCYRSIFIVSFILQIVALVLFLAQLIYNIIKRKVMNEPRQKEEGYASVPAHQSVPTDPHMVPAATVGPGSENRIA